MDTGNTNPDVAADRPLSPFEAEASASHGRREMLTAAAGVPVLASTELLKGGKSVLISHKGAFYRLQSTRQGKLILTK